MQHYFIDQALTVNEQLELPPEIQKHWIRVLRAQPGEQAEFVDDQQQVFIGELTNGDQGLVQIKTKTDLNTELPIAVTVACGLPKSGKAELIVQKATELGASEIIFLPTEWSVAQWKQKAAKKVARLQKIAQAAAEQSHRNLIPQVSYLNGLAALDQLNVNQRVVAYEEAAKQGEASELVRVVSQMQAGQRLLAVFGPEGGLSPAEIERLEAANFHVVGLGPRILRTESAPLYFLSAISVLSELK
ncbi:16S rRNA (uracil(1498)-N(3))-methyltransferase [Fructilactobacillus hinvesii]|uniref:Ribosomal RNA small subunit methyltransferase E n=1 Tax=Fructilactobacillus hinvesii TaxID=2940300 RepID=A0ABY5BQX3_9LACO|nr:16S rRNA (uracil(1498)-N(3))-methyltransferase [Fructilactobacillus hinvesii]USS87375.1 16S rRNA (uracil(1498)-N(3))-methyltransferase [Fructilactobacillus hinvesii]